MDTFSGFIRCHNLKLTQERIYISNVNWKCDCERILTSDKIEIIISNNNNNNIVVCIQYENNLGNYSYKFLYKSL